MDQNEEKKEIESLDATIKELKKKRKDLANNTVYETFSLQKFLKGMFSLFNPVEWIKTLKEIGIFDVRKWIIYGLIFCPHVETRPFPFHASRRATAP